jgi:hypothetical protein
MKKSIVIAISLMVFARIGFSEVRVSSATTAECGWTYDPGNPTVERADTVNPSGVILHWNDAGYVICRDVIQPVRFFYVVVPPGASPQLQVSAVESKRRDNGMRGTPALADVQQESPIGSWAQVVSIQSWRGFRLACVAVPLQIGDRNHSEILSHVAVRISFAGARLQSTAVQRDKDILKRVAVNGDVGAGWWQESQPRSVLDERAAWPDLDLQRMAVTETGLYEITGSSILGASLLGQPTNKIKVFGNGGRLLPSSADAVVDSVLREDAIMVEDRNANGVFDQSDRLLFFGRGLKGADYCDATYLQGWAHQSPFSTENVYWLGVDLAGSDGLRMAPLATGTFGQPETTTMARAYLEQDVFIFGGGLQTESGLVWYMSTLDRAQSRSYTLNLEGATGSAAQLKLGAVTSAGYVNNNFDIYVGASRIWTGQLPGNGQAIAVAPGILQPGANRVDLHNRSDATININYVEIQYERTISAASGAVEFFAPSGQTGVFQYSVADFGTGGYVLDVTDPVHPRATAESVISDSSFAGNARRYYAVRPDGSGHFSQPIFRGTKPARPNQDCPRLRDPLVNAGMILLTFDDGYDALDSLRAFHNNYREEKLPTVRVRLSDVYDEFGWGVHDAVAIRNFLRYAYQNWRYSIGDSVTAPVKYVLFVGDGNYDYRGLVPGGDPVWMPPWEESSHCRDDFYLEFAGSVSLPQILSGRWPVQGLSELQAAVSKTIAYADRPLYGPWKNTATFAADDEWKDGAPNEREHTAQAESLINTVLPSYFTFKKIYEILYPFRSSPTGMIKPDATRDLIESINRGTLIVNFTGHGNPRVWTDEQLFVMDRDKSLLDNNRMWPLFVAATCSWGMFDQPIGRCFPEILLADPRGGSIASVAATRFTYVDQNNALTDAFYHELFRPGLASRLGFGEAMLQGKSAAGPGGEDYHVLGDPVLRLATPEFFARITSSADSLQALSLYHLSGEVSRSDTDGVWPEFNGVVEARVYDTEDSAAYYWGGDITSAPYYYRLPGNAIFRGTASVTSGRFDVDFRVPRDVRYGGNNAKISLYFYGKATNEADSADGIGIREHLLIASEAAAQHDSVPPTIGAWLEVPSFRSGDLVSSTPKLHVNLVDSSGINLSGEVGHKITGRIDDAQTEDLTPFFNYNLNSHTSGSLEKVVGPLAAGEHRMVVEAWDAFNNLNQTSLTFVVGQSGEAGYEIKDVYNWPNPMSNITYFTYFLTQSGTRKVSLKIFTLTGKLIDEIQGLDIHGPAFNSNTAMPWYGRDRDGRELANGVYFYKIRADKSDGRSAEATGKLVILR